MAGNSTDKVEGTYQYCNLAILPVIYHVPLGSVTSYPKRSKKSTLGRNHEHLQKPQISQRTKEKH